MKKPCDTCHIAICTYYEYPCCDCIHNPHSAAEIGEELKTTIDDEERTDFYKHYIK